jgi:FMN phosphatase YigB (HAD superfamily)
VPEPTPTLVLDFDGTLCLGDDPILLFADELSTLVEQDAAEQVRRDLVEFLAGRLQVEGSEDGYHALYHLGRPHGLPQEQVAAAYYASRRRMAAGEGEVHPPDGILDLLDDVRAAGVRVVLITTAPVTGATDWLDAVGIGERLDAVVADAGKPHRMGEHLRELLAQAGASDRPELLLSVGDVWANDVEPAMALGARGLHIDRFGVARTPSTAAAPTFGELYPLVRAWAADPSAPLPGEQPQVFT